MNEPTLLAQWRKEQGGNLNIQTRQGSEIPPEDADYEPSPISEYERQNGIPYLVDKLDIKNDYILDSNIEIKTRAIEDFIKEEVIRDSTVSYQVILDRILDRLPEPLERMLQGKQNLKVLDILFQEVALQNKLSGKSYLKIASENIKYQKVESLKKQLKELLQNV